MNNEIFEALTSGPAHSFRDALHETLPLASIGVYTIWCGNEFVYVGIAGRNLDLAVEHKRMRGVRDRLDSHRSGRRSGDQFALYVCDRLVLATLTAEQIEQISALRPVTQMPRRTPSAARKIIELTFRPRRRSPLGVSSPGLDTTSMRRALP